jgi:hypothetical protein
MKRGRRHGRARSSSRREDAFRQVAGADAAENEATPVLAPRAARIPFTHHADRHADVRCSFRRCSFGRPRRLPAVRRARIVASVEACDDHGMRPNIVVDAALRLARTRSHAGAPNTGNHE